jgi:hypothetical protein
MAVMSSIREHDVFFVPAQFGRIQDAIDAVAGPATIMIEPGIYDESLQVIGKQYLVVESTRLGRRGVVITGNTEANVVTVESSKLYLSGIEIRSNRRARGIRAIDSSISLQECVVAGNAIGAGDAFGAGMCCHDSSVRIQKSIVAGNTVDCGSSEGGGGGLYLVDCKVEIAGSSLQTNEVYATDVARGGGVWCERSQLRLWRSRITENWLFAPRSEGAGAYFRDAAATQLGGSVISGNGSVAGKGGGVFISGDRATVAIHRNTVIRQNHPDDLHHDGSILQTSVELC